MLYNFENLRTLINKIAPSPAKIREKYLIVEGEEFENKANEDNVEYRENGIFVKIDGEEFQRYIYKKYYYISRYGKFPKFHFIRCSTVMEYGISNYCSASKEKVLVIDRDTGEKHFDKTLDVCGNCSREASVNVPRDTVAFFQNLGKKPPEEVRKQDVDIFGYTFDWHEVRVNYLEMQDSKCERCTIQMAGYDTRYIHVHHKNGDKKQNDLSNLECLCVLCHSFVDERHIENFKKRRMKVQVDEFVKKYYADIKGLNNSCLSRYEQNKVE